MSQFQTKIHLALQASLSTAIAQYEEVMGEAFPIVPKLDVRNDKEFWALAELDDNGLVIRVGGGVVPILVALWDYAFEDTVLIKSLFTADQADVIHVSLVWLMLHEMGHFELGHFEIIGKQVITETAKGREFGLLSRTPEQRLPFEALNNLDYIQIERCLELQADHEAIDVFLEGYSSGAWEELRLRVTCISAVMVLIDVEDSKHTLVDSSHPKAATRIFQLLGHLSEMPLTHAQLSGDNNNIPSDEEQHAFSKQVVIPAFFNVIALAKAASAEHILDELGDIPAFFGDMLLAKTNSLGDIDQFKTVGAKEWASLIAINERILSQLT